jgi:hypothetical protein
MKLLILKGVAWAFPNTRTGRETNNSATGEYFPQSVGCSTHRTRAEGIVMKIRAAVVFYFICVNCGGDLVAADATALLREADRYADAGNWVAARDLYAQAEQGFRASGDTRNELYAKFGRMHRDVEAGSYSTVSREVQADLAKPTVQNDPALKIRALSLKGTIDLNLNTARSESSRSRSAIPNGKTGRRANWASSPESTAISGLLRSPW